MPDKSISKHLATREEFHELVCSHHSATERVSIQPLNASVFGLRFFKVEDVEVTASITREDQRKSPGKCAARWLAVPCAY
jgi:hypothetical protein